MLNIGMLKNRVYNFFFTVYKFGNSYPGLGVVFGCCHGDLLFVQDHLTAPLLLRTS